MVRFKAAGLIVLGKTNVPEFGMLPTTESALYGPCHNPWNLEHSTGGSSGGSAAAVAAGIVPLAHANDGGGSIRIPASCCGLVGLKPTRGAQSAGPGHRRHHRRPDRRARRQPHGARHRGGARLHARSRAGRPLRCAAGGRPFLDEVSTPPGRLRIAFATNNFGGAPLHPECVAAVERTAKLLEELGHVVEEARPTSTTIS